MKPFNIEFFDADFNCIAHSTVDGNSLKLSYDYLDPENNKIKVLPPCAGDVNNYIRLTGNGLDMWNIVTKKDISKEESSGTIEYTFKDFEDLLDVEVVVDTDQIGIGSLEEFIAGIITDLYIENEDEHQNIPGLVVQTSTETLDWELDLTAESEDDHYCKAKLLDDVILPAFKQDFIRVLFTFDIKNRQIIADISVCENAVLNYETILPNVLTSSIKYKLAKKEINKDIICNKKHYETQVIFYLHTDGTHDTVDADRVLPVVRKLETVSTRTEEEWIDKWVKDLNSAANTVSSDQNSLDKGDELDEDKLEKLLEAVATLNRIPGLEIVVDETTGRVQYIVRHSIDSYEVQNEFGTTVHIEDTFDDSTDSYEEEQNPQGGLTVTLTDIYSEQEPYSKELVQSIIDEYATTERYLRQCAVIAWSEFMEKAQAKADKTFNSNKYENNIEIKVMSDDTMLSPLSMEIGQIVNIIDHGNAYQTILSGRKTEKGTTTLIFGTQRIELTKILKGRD